MDTTMFSLKDLRLHVHRKKSKEIRLHSFLQRRFEKTQFHISELIPNTESMVL